MRIPRFLAALAIGAASLSFGGHALAANILCETETKNHMLVDSTYVSACIDAGVGNIGQGNQANDDFLKQFGSPDFGGYTTIGAQGWSQSGSSGTFTLWGTPWNAFNDLYIGFKFGTGNQPDEWFVYRLQSGVTSGTWNFVNVFGKGGGLSHVTLYGKDRRPDQELPEPATLGLAGLALLGLALSRRRKA